MQSYTLIDSFKKHVDFSCTRKSKMSLKIRRHDIYNTICWLKFSIASFFDIQSMFCRYVYIITSMQDIYLTTFYACKYFPLEL